MDHQTIVNFSTPHPSPPVVTLGLNFLDFDNSRNLRIRSVVEAVLPSQAVLNLQSWADTIQYASGVSWFLLPADDEDFRHGSFTTKDVRAAKTIVFDRPYPGPTPPKVLVSFTALDIDKSANCRVQMYATDMTIRGFTLNVETWSNTKLSEGGVSWISISADKKSISAGRFSTKDIAAAAGTTRKNRQSTVAFSPAFTNPPKIFLALNMLDLDRGSQTRVRLSGGSISGAIPPCTTLQRRTSLSIPK
ncbi:hypothetical protein ACEPPN_018678 [Leptodophora sp. 'Broadleaf-Isolate-01']